MTEQAIRPEKITKPIQLLGAWLAGLFTIDSCFLFAAAKMQEGSWESGALTIAAIVNVPLFLTAVFLLQTRFRPELQEDSYYSTYLSKKTNELVNVSKEDSHLAQLRLRLAEIESKITSPANEVAEVNGTALSGLHVGVNTHLADRQHIGVKLFEHGVLGFTSFGSENNVPKERVVAISAHLSKERVGEIIRVAKELGFTGYMLFDNLFEETEEDVLFGAYGAAEYEIAGV